MQAALNLKFAILCLKFQITGIESEVMSKKFESRLLESQVYNRKWFCDEFTIFELRWFMCALDECG